MVRYRHERPRARVEKGEQTAAEFPPRAEWLVDVMREYLRSRGLSYSVAAANNWYPTLYAGDFRARIVIPAVTSAHQPYWQARAMTDAPWVKRYYSPAAPRGDAIVLVKPDHCSELGVVIAEGPLDALAAAEVGYVGIALMGNDPPGEVLNHVAARIDRIERRFVAADRDAVGAGLRIRAWLASYLTGYVWFIDPSPFKDLADMPVNERKRRLRG